MIQQDLFDLLPDDFIISEILPRLGSIKLLGRLSSASKNLQTLCRFSPVLDIGAITDDIANYVDKFFAFRASSDVKFAFRRFKVRIKETKHSTTLKYNEYIHKWFQDALSLNVEELILEVKPLRRNSTVQTQVLSFLKLPSFPLEHLTFLSLENLPAALGPNFGEWVSNCCVSLEELRLKDIYICAPNLRIKSSSLRVLMIQAHFRELHVVSAPRLVKLIVMWNLTHVIGRDEMRLRVSWAPNLEGFLLNWNAPMGIDYWSCDGDGRNFPSLKHTSIAFPEVAELSLGSLEKLLRDICCTRTLLVTEALLQQVLALLYVFLSLCSISLKMDSINFRGKFFFFKRVNFI